MRPFDIYMERISPDLAKKKPRLEPILGAALPFRPGVSPFDIYMERIKPPTPTPLEPPPQELPAPALEPPAPALEPRPVEPPPAVPPALEPRPRPEPIPPPELETRPQTVNEFAEAIRDMPENFQTFSLDLARGGLTPEEAYAEAHRQLYGDTQPLADEILSFLGDRAVQAWVGSLAGPVGAAVGALIPRTWIEGIGEMIAPDPEALRGLVTDIGIGIGAYKIAEGLLMAAHKGPPLARVPILAASFIAGPIYAAARGAAREQAPLETLVGMPGEVAWWVGIPAAGKLFQTGWQRSAQYRAIANTFITRYGDAAWKRIEPALKRAGQVPVPPGPWRDWLGVEKLADVLPASVRMEPMMFGMFRRGAQQRGLAAGIIEKQFAPAIAAANPLDRLDIMRAIKTGEIPEGASERARALFEQYEEGKELLFTRPSLKLKPEHADILRRSFDDGLDRLFNFDAETYNVLRATLGAPAKKSFRAGQKQLAAIIENPLLKVDVRNAARELHDIPANFPREIYEAYKDGTVSVLKEKVLSNKAWHQIDPKVVREGFVKSDIIKHSVGGVKSDVYVKREIERGLKEIEYVSSEMETFFNRYFIAPWKMVKVVMRMPTQFRNLMGNIILNDITGPHPLSFYNVPVYFRALKELRQGGPMAREFMEVAGIDTTTFIGAELANFFLPRKYAVGRLWNALDMAYHGLYKLGRPFADLYQFNEKWAKLAKYINNRKYGMTEIDSALDAIKSTFDYNDVSIFTRKMRETAFPFFTWKAKIFQHFPEAAVKHPIRVAKWAMFPAALTAIALENLNISHSEWEDAKGILPEHLKRGLVALIPFRDERGNLQFWNASWIIPGVGDVTGMGAATEIHAWIQNPIINVVADLRENKRGLTGRPIWNEWDHPTVKLMKGLYYPIQQITPAFLPGGTDFETMWRTFVEKDPVAFGPTAAVISQFGIRMSPYNPYEMDRRRAGLFHAKRAEILRSKARELRAAATAEERAEIERFYAELLRDSYREEFGVAP
ncbi:MAG: hypothetical protein DDT19_01662 [Syntrophomonadaceae bacterium]|nr:hypothetical protein [Bacillota bacterium]